MALSPAPSTPVDNIVENPQEDLLNALSALHFGGKYSDLTITCNYRQWAVHRAIVCSRSGFFDGACSSGFLEAASGDVDLSEDDEDAVEQMIHFFYHLDYMSPQAPKPITMFRHRARSCARRRLPRKLDLTHIEDPLLALAACYDPEDASPTSPTDSHQSFSLSEDKPQLLRTRSSSVPSLAYDSESDEESSDIDELPEAEPSHLLLHTRVYALAEKYDIPSLKQLAKKKFEMEMACYFDSPELAEAIEDVYCSTIDSDRGLRDVVIEAFKAHPELESTQDVYAVVHSTPTLERELWKIQRGLPV
ncbi:uncharacterized protein LTR77_005163 [Saxophila tyrrhenica]|uniref:BTB domain-containing protein n=1 Tax=Saxophila tyrrhenica TaxID=1690608 RepID=A0AAV9PBW5_9PEZI|nr:hypothetical protein LTR77_005163 [Saxophila tyrrhenica]